MFKLIETILAGKIKTQPVNNMGEENFRGELVLQPQACEQCNKCVEVCPMGAITTENAENLPGIDYKRCLFCGMCVEICQKEALQHTRKDAAPLFSGDNLAELNVLINKRIGRSLAIRHLDAGSCNACDFEMGALSNPIYDLQHYGMSFVASPRHADLLMVTGVVTRNLEQALIMSYEAMQEPKLVMAVGACAISGGIFGENYATVGALEKVLPVDIALPGCPPRPAAMLLALAAAADIYAAKKK
ncbi:MAG: NADH-quinone oxidoreductase subunit NuoB [Acidaminococcaceae bacterium]|nr:NADH-quinone oxidoreductase subunit NuoB [Acidaminococcaceae bacterium]MDD4721828.1 NADH-quinone oxidoreductase subunit NuoB [Acidaminococcaceae bacterium]